MDGDTGNMLLKKKYVLLTLAVIIAVLILIGVLFKYQEILIFSNDGKEVKYFTGKLLNYNVLGKKQRLSFKGFKILKITKDKAEIIGVIKMEDKKYITCILNDTVNIYTVEGNLIESFKTGGDNTIFSSCIEDLNTDSCDELLLLTGKKGGQFGENLIVMSFDGKLKEIFKRSFKNINPWKVQTADVDGDGLKEISVGVYKKAEFHPVMAKRPFIYNWYGDHITPKWRGSRLARPFDDYIFADIGGDGTDEIVSIETLANGNKVVNLYRWKGFGFEGMGESVVFDDIAVIMKRDIKEKGCKIYAKIRENNRFEWVVLHYKDGKLLLEEKLKNYVPEKVIN